MFGKPKENPTEAQPSTFTCAAVTRLASRYRPRERYYEPEARRYYEPEAEPRYYEPQPETRYYEPEPPVAGPQLRFDLGGGDEPQYSPPNPAFRTWNNCPPLYTVQDGLCKPYKGR